MSFVSGVNIGSRKFVLGGQRSPFFIPHCRKRLAQMSLVDVNGQKFVSREEAADMYPKEAKMCGLLEHKKLGKAP